MSMAAGEPAAAPFGYRVLVPWLVGSLPVSHETGFTLVNRLSLLAAGCTLFLWARQFSTHPVFLPAVLLLYLTSYLSAYYTNAVALVDPLALFLLVLVLLLAKRVTSPVVISALLMAAAVVHESALFVVPVLWFDHAVRGPLARPSRYGWSDLVVITASCVAALIVSRGLIPVSPDQRVYYIQPVAMASWVVQASGGPAWHLARVYSAWGPAWIICFLQVFRFESRAVRWVFSASFAMLLVTTLLAIDTLRVASLLYPLIILFGGRAVLRLVENSRYALAASYVLAQMAYSMTVFGHLGSVESSRPLMSLALGLSCIVLVLAGYDLASSRANRPAVSNPPDPKAVL